MTTSHAASSAAPAEKQASKYVLQDWEPNNPEKWDSKLAWRTLTITTYSLILGFCVWFLPSAIAPKLTLLGFNLSASQLYWLTALPGLAAGLLRLVYMFLPPLIGTRKMVGITSLLFLIPMLGWFYAVQDNTTPYAVLLTLAFMCGIGGAAFSGYMPSTGYFFPKRLSGTAVPLQFKLHIIAAFILFAAWPFTRLVHVVSAPVAYPTRPYVVYRSRRAATSTSRPARGWTPVRGGAAGPKAQSFPEDDAPYQGA